MARIHSKAGRVLVNDVHVSADITGWTAEHRRSYGEVTTLLSDGEQWVPGLLAGRVALRGVADADAGHLLGEVDAAAAVAGGLLVTVAPQGLTVGGLAFVADGNVSARAVDSTVKETVGLTAEGTPDDGVDWGVLLHALTARTGDGQESSVDSGAASASGGVGSLHVTACSGFTSVSIRIQDSPDDSLWADLITFSSVTGTTWQRSTVTGAVDQHLRAWWDVDGAGSITFAVAFARR